VRFALPFDAQVAVITNGDPALLELEGRRTWEVPPSIAANANALEHLQDQGAQFLLVPDGATQSRFGLDGHRKVREESGCCTIYALHSLEDDFHRKGPTPSGLPLPPPEMLALTIGDYRAQPWLLGGREVAGQAAALLGHHGLALEDFEAMLDFGCGCGRITRRWQHLKGARISGVDYNPYLVEWCREHLPFASFERAAAGQPLPFADDSLDFVWSFSVFTHLDREAQDHWMHELRRVAAPGAVLLITLHGDACREHLGDAERAAYDAGEMVIREEGMSGSNRCSVYHPPAYVHGRLARGLDVIEIATGAFGLQDGVLLRNRP
jgi:SAM-dependent methyltransferase